MSLGHVGRNENLKNLWVRGFDLGLRVLGFMVEGSRLGVEVSEFKVSGLDSGIWRLGFRVKDSGFGF